MVFKGCPRCGGDVYNEEEFGQVDLVCLQCGARRTMEIDFIEEARRERARARWARDTRPVEAVA